MHFVFNGGTPLQIRWFLEAARSLEGELTWAEEFIHSEFRDWLPVIEGYPIFELPMLVNVTWEHDPEPSVHNEWAYTENFITEIEGPGPAPWLGPVYFSPHLGGDDWTDVPFGIYSDLAVGAVLEVLGTEWPTSKLQIKHDLENKGEEIYKYVVRHELGHVIMNTLTDGEIGNLALTFGLHDAGAPALEWFYGEGKPWAQKGKESVAETVADLFWLGPTRGPGRYSFNRTRFKLTGEDRELAFISELAPRRPGFSSLPSPGHPPNPYAQNSDHPPVVSSRTFAAGESEETIQFDWGDGPPDWTEQQTVPPPEPVLWRVEFTAGGFGFTTDPASYEGNPFVTEINPVAWPHAAAVELYPELIFCPGGISVLQMAWLVADTFFEQATFTGIIDDVGIPIYGAGTGVLDFEVTDASGRPCWLPQITSIGSPYFPYAGSHVITGHRGVEKSYTFFDPDGAPLAPGEHFSLDPRGWLHDPRIELEPVLAGTSLEPDTLGEPVYKIRPDCSSIELPLKVRMAASASGTTGEVSAGAGGDVPTPQGTIIMTKDLTLPAFAPPWPYVGSIKALPAPPGTRPRKPTVGAPAGALSFS